MKGLPKPADFRILKALRAGSNGAAGRIEPIYL
ncbi:hypothetical protein X772_21205 [Mesorhizobium sp. LSJC280B00]|nr:hypothetical protein X772_21205 [Mesorhizobium sp. LSJC280B00]